MFALNTTKEGYVCTTSREIELSVRPIIFSLQIYFVGTRRGSDIFPVCGRERCHYDSVMDKALLGDRELNIVYFEKMECTASKIETSICGS